MVQGLGVWGFRGFGIRDERGLGLRVKGLGMEGFGDGGVYGFRGLGFFFG